jgi:exopolyphosphatase/guanosine-5'-triphosphate,3'-diphosphate pyrophosphatase
LNPNRACYLETFPRFLWQNGVVIRRTGNPIRNVLMKIAAMDLGSNSFHMLVANIIGPQSFETILRERMNIQLGKSALLTGRLDQEAMERGIRCIEEFRHLALARRVERTFAVATSAIREAENGEDFIRRIGEATGIAVHAISGAEEARLIYLAVRRNVDFGKKTVLLIDIGGGSIELTVADSAKIHYCTSQKLGFLRIHGRFAFSDPMTKRQELSIRKLSKADLSSFLVEVRQYRPQLVIATSGMATTLLKIATCQSSRPQESMFVGKDQVTSILKAAVDMEPLERAKTFDMDLHRAEYFPTALLCFKTILDGVDAEEFIVSSVSLREGLVYDFLARKKPQIPKRKPADSQDLHFDSVLDLAARCGYPQEHSRHVAQLADQIFHQTMALHGLGKQEARLLNYASILHDIGYHIAYNRHHKHGYYLVMNGELHGFAPEEREMIAQLVRYHRGAKPKKSHAAFAALPRKSRQIIKVLSAILRIADSLDRSHALLTDRVQCVVEKDTVQFRVSTGARLSDLDLDLNSAKRKARCFEKVFGFNTSFVAVRSKIK